MRLRRLIIATLQSDLRTESSKYRLCIMDQAFADIEALATYTCEPDPKYGDKPAEQVRKGAGRAVEILTRNMKAVSNTGVVKISSRTLPLTIRVSLAWLSLLVVECALVLFWFFSFFSTLA